MFSGPIIGLIAAISASTWIYTWSMRRTGNNTQNAGIISAIAGIIVFFMVWSIIALIDATLGD
ncbi:MAG: hypothetical protein AAB423_03560 [Patescibacteria group bacterium]